MVGNQNLLQNSSEEDCSISGNGEKQYSTVTVVIVQYYCYSVICLAQDLFTTRSLHQPHSLTINLKD